MLQLFQDQKVHTAAENIVQYLGMSGELSLQCSAESTTTNEETMATVHTSGDDSHWFRFHQKIIESNKFTTMGYVQSGSAFFS